MSHSFNRHSCGPPGSAETVWVLEPRESTHIWSGRPWFTHQIGKKIFCIFFFYYFIYSMDLSVGSSLSEVSVKTCCCDSWSQVHGIWIWERRVLSGRTYLYMIDFLFLFPSRPPKIWRTMTKSDMTNSKDMKWWRSMTDRNTWKRWMRMREKKRRSTMRRWKRSMPTTRRSTTQYVWPVDAEVMSFAMAKEESVWTVLSSHRFLVAFCRAARINWGRSGRKLMAWTRKTLIPRLSSNCTVVSSQVPVWQNGNGWSCID